MGMKMELDQERIENGIIKEAAANIIGNEELYDRVKRAIDLRIDKLWKETAEERIRSEVELAIAAGFEKSYRKVDSFGRVEGEPTTIRAELEKLIAGYWNASVDRQGKPSNSYGATTTRAEWMMSQMVAADFQGEMKNHVINLGGALKDALRAELHETVNKLLSDVFKVRSIDDQGKKRGDSSIIQPPAAPIA
jgi:hypothetical protein